MRRRHAPAAPADSVDVSEARGVRFLHFGSDWVQGAMRVARPWALELAYTRDMMLPLLFRDTPPRHVLMIGLGAGSQAKFLYRNFPDCRITAVEINPQVVAIAQHYFKLPDDPVRLPVIIADGAEFLLAGGRAYDLILLDGFDADAGMGGLDTLPVFQACRARLAEHGVLSVNLLGRQRGYAASVERLGAAFDDCIHILAPCESGNIAAFGGTAPCELSRAMLGLRAEQLLSATGLDLTPALSRLSPGKPGLLGSLA